MERKTFIYQVLFILLSSLFCPLPCIGSNLVGTTFYSYGICKNEKLTFLSDSICIYQQTWDSCALVGILHQHTDTFVYYSCGIKEGRETKIEPIVIKKINLPETQKPLTSPIDEELYQQMCFTLPKIVGFFDCSSRNIIIGETRRSRYNMWDMPSYRGKKNKLADAYATLFNIDNDTIWLYDNKIALFGSTNILLYAPEALEVESEGYNATLISQERGSYEYQKYCYSTGLIAYPYLAKDLLIGHRFYCSNMEDKEESLTFINDSCCEIIQNKKEKTDTVHYSIKSNFIILQRNNELSINPTVADTLAYNNGFIFYAKVYHYKVDDQYTELQIKAYHERRNNTCKSNRHRQWEIANEAQAKQKKYDYPEYALFSQICFNTYIPINWK